VFDAYQQEILKIDPQSKTHLTIDDFKAGLRDQYLQQVVTRKVQEQLVPESSFTPTTDPSNITVRHILIKVTAPISATQTERDAAFAARRPAAEAILAQLRGGADFAAVAKERSDDYATKENGGELPSFDKTGKTQESSQIDPAIVSAALALKENETSGLLQTPFGWDIIQLVKRQVDSKADQLQAARTKAFDEWVAQQRAPANIQRFPPATPTPTALPTGTALPLPTVVLDASPTPTAVLTQTATLSGTATLTGTPALQLTPTATTTPSAAPAPTSPATPQGTAAPTAVLPTPTPKP
jgi:hypothetical protein